MPEVGQKQSKMPAEINPLHTPQEAKDELLAAQKEKDSEMKEYLTIPPGGKPPYAPEPPPEPEVESETQKRTRLDMERRMKEENEKRIREAPGAKVEAEKPEAAKPDYDANYKSGKQAKEEEENKAKSYTLGGGKKT